MTESVLSFGCVYGQVGRLVDIFIYLQKLLDHTLFCVFSDYISQRQV